MCCQFFQKEKKKDFRSLFVRISQMQSLQRGQIYWEHKLALILLLNLLQQDTEPPDKNANILRNCQLHAWAQSTITREVWELKGLTPRD